jgi:hypothetical protein
MEWIPVAERMPKASNKMTHDDDVLVYIPPYNRELTYEGGKPLHFSGGFYTGHPNVTKTPVDEKGERDFWGIPTEESDWTIWGYNYFLGAPKPTHWMPLPKTPEVSE